MFCCSFFHIFPSCVFQLLFLSKYLIIYWKCMCAASTMEGRLLTFAISGRPQPSSVSIKAIKRLSLWIEISVNYHIWGRDQITSSFLSLALTSSSGCVSENRIYYDFTACFGVFHGSKTNSGGSILHIWFIVSKYENFIWKRVKTAL